MDETRPGPPKAALPQGGGTEGRTARSATEAPQQGVEARPDAARPDAARPDAARPTVKLRAEAPPRAAGAGLSALPPLSLYVHVPWCVRKCPYCDFNSHAVPAEGLPERGYLDALMADLEQALPQVWGRQVVSVFFGGGTPSLLSGKAVDEILSGLRARLNLLPDAEITLEANPGTAEAGRFADYAASGVNRLSLGIQSFDDRALRALGRIHDGGQARRAIEQAQQAGLRVNLDLMYGLPGQDLVASADDLRQALSFGTGHLSVYHLTLEPNTVFAKYPPVLPEDDLAAAMHEQVIELLDAGGWSQYEVSAYARAGQRCRHNLNYWTFGDYLGIGPGAHGKLSFHDGIVREARLRQPASWMAAAVRRDGSHLASREPVPPESRAFEFMLNALRLKDGVPAASFVQYTGLPLSAIARARAEAERKGLLEPDPAQLRATPLGWRFLSDLQALFLD